MLSSYVIQYYMDWSAQYDEVGFNSYYIDSNTPEPLVTLIHAGLNAYSVNPEGKGLEDYSKWKMVLIDV